MITSDDVLAAADSCRKHLGPHTGPPERWALLAGDLEWTCRGTLDHVADALTYYAGNLATRTPVQRPRLRNGDSASTIDALLTAVETAATILATVATATPPDTRSFHRAGMADVSGFMAMGCAEILIHTDDIAAGLHTTPPYRGDPELSARLVQRLFPWAPQHDDAWELLRWSMGRTALPEHERLGPDWWWFCAPLEEWDGTPRTSWTPPPT